MTELYRFAAFISYSSKDSVFAKRLMQVLESYHIPAQLGTFDLIGGGKKNRIFPVCRDREELPSGDLGEAIESALKASSALIVVCSPNAAASPWVNKEIESFLALGRRGRIFAIIHPDAPLVDSEGGDATVASFPPAFRGEGAEGGLEPIAGDARPTKDGFRSAWLKVVAGAIGVNAGALQDRDKRRRRAQRVQLGMGVGTAALALALSGATRDAQAWRTQLMAVPDRLSARNYPVDRLTYAVATSPTIGQFLRTNVPEATSVLRDEAVLPRIAVLGPLREWKHSENGQIVAIMRKSSASPEDYVVSTGMELHRLFSDKPALKVVPIEQFDISGDGHLLATWRRLEPVMLWDLQTASAPKAALELPSDQGMSRFQLSDDGKYLLVTAEREKLSALFDLSGTRRHVVLGKIGQSVQLTRNANVLVTEYEDENGEFRSELRRAETGYASEQLFAGIEELRVDRTGTIVDGFKDDEHQIIDLNRKLWRQEKFHRMAVSADGTHLVYQYAGASTATHAEATADNQRIEIRGFPEVEELTVSDSGKALWSCFSGGVAAAKLIENSKVAVWPNVECDDIKLSSSGEVAVSIDEYNENDLRQYRFTRLRIDGGPSETLGVFGHVRRWALSNNGEVLLVAERYYGSDQRLIVADLRTPGAAPGRPAFNSTPRVNGDVGHCAKVGATLTPLDRAAPAQGTAKSDVSILVGRPWNPCDWRGIAATLPDHARGDGWFEGPRQWLRLMHVRHFGGRDWTCAETLPNASAKQKADRKNMCDLFGPPARPAPAPGL